MRVGVVTTSYPRWEGDHAGNFVAAHVRELQRAGHTVEVIAAGEEFVDEREPRTASKFAAAERGRISDEGGPSLFGRIPDARSDDDDVKGHADGSKLGAASRDRVYREHSDTCVAVTRIPAGSLFYTGGAPDRLERSPVRSAIDAAAFSARMTAAIVRHAPQWDAIVAHWLAPSALAVVSAQALSPLAALPDALTSIRALRRMPWFPAVTGFIGQLAPTKKPLLAIAHGGDVHTLRRTGLLGPALHRLHAANARIVFVSVDLREIAIAAAPTLRRWLSSSLIQPMGIDTAHFAALPRTPTTPPTIGCVARMTPVKGIDVLLDALARVTTPVRVVIAGSGPEHARLMAHAERVVAHGTSSIEFVGSSARDHVLSVASTLVVPSRVVDGRTEGAPLIAIEALAAGVPVVATAVGGLRDMPGLRLVPPDDPRALAAAIDAELATKTDPVTLRALVTERDWRTVAARLMPVW